MVISKVRENKNFIQAIFGEKNDFGGKVCGKVRGEVGEEVVGNGCGKVESGAGVVEKVEISTECTHNLHGDFHGIFERFLSVICEFSKFYTGPITINIKYIN
ncbi:hypothetical protein IJG76_00345 [Candidatus Saccharibacteria bacterium]|nr:hypothetical protein [Candidatus Saccharibacteria bacterium]